MLARRVIYLMSDIYTSEVIVYCDAVFHFLMSNRPSHPPLLCHNSEIIQPSVPEKFFSNFPTSFRNTMSNFRASKFTHPCYLLKYLQFCCTYIRQGSKDIYEVLFLMTSSYFFDDQKSVFPKVNRESSITLVGFGRKKLVDPSNEN